MVGSNNSRRLAERIRREINIIDVVSEFLKLCPRGKFFVSECPWHDDSRSSLLINPKLNSWKCWVCDVGGDSIEFVARYNHLSFVDAVRELAERLVDE